MLDQRSDPIEDPLEPELAFLVPGIRLVEHARGQEGIRSAGILLIALVTALATVTRRTRG